VRPRLVLNRPYTVPGTGEQRPTELLDVGNLRWGTADPSDPRLFDSRVTVSGTKDFVELRLPWAMLTFSDPSSHLVWVPKGDGSVDTLKVGPRIGIQVAAKDQPAVATNGYAWEDWNRVEYHERRKAGWPTVRRSMQEAAARR
jgi:hypothetical protein